MLVLDPVGADGGDVNARAQQLVMQGFGVALQKSLGRGINAEAGHGLESRGGTDFEDAAAFSHIGQTGGGDGDGGAAVQVDHIGLLVGGEFGGFGDFAEARRADQHVDGWLFGGEEGRQLSGGVGIRQIHGERPHGHRQRDRKSVV